MNINNFHKNKSFFKKHLGSIIKISIIVRIKPESHKNIKNERKGGELKRALWNSKTQEDENTDKIKKEQSQDKISKPW